MTNLMLEHMPKQHKWSDRELAAEARKYSTRGDFRKGSPGAYQATARRKLLDLFCEHMTAQRQSWADWTLEEFHREALKYPTRGAFCRGSSGVYQAAYQKGILEQICTHMEYQLQPWSEEQLIVEASKYQTRFEFKKGSQKAYHAAQRRGLLDEICQHMTPNRLRSDNDAVYLWRVRHTAIFKVGITSTRLNLERITHVASVSGLTPELIILTTCEEPKTVEQQVLKLGLPARFHHPFNGHTEFRWLSDAEVAQAIRIITSSSWLNYNL